MLAYEKLLATCTAAAVLLSCSGAAQAHATPAARTYFTQFSISALKFLVRTCEHHT